jgi:glutathione synthase/RimK-type ligase-like ATP-grasp enzyme
MTEQPFRLAIVTGRLAPALSDNGQQVTTTLAERGFHCEPVMWDDPTVDWRSYDGVLIRSCWDYPEDRGRFQTMLDEIETAGVPVCNPLPVLRWNLHKSYLTDLSKEGVLIPETAVIDRETDISLKQVMLNHDWEEVVVKPAIGAGSVDVWRTTATTVTDSERRFRDLLAEHDVIVQEFVSKIRTGERSIVFFDGAYSHAWNSLPTQDDIAEFDEINAHYEPPAKIQNQAAAVVESATEIIGLEQESLPYARVDYVHRDTDLLVMELELIEPYLGLDRGDTAVEQFSEKIVSFFKERV